MNEIWYFICLLLALINFREVYMNQTLQLEIHQIGVYLLPIAREKKSFWDAELFFLKFFIYSYKK